MPLKHRKAEEVPPSSTDSSSAEFNQIKVELARLQPGMVLEVDAGSQKALRKTKAMLTRAGKQIGRTVVHGQQGGSIALPSCLAL